MKPKASVIIPTYKRPENIIRAVKSVVNQDFAPVEILVIDDNGKGSKCQIETERLINKHFSKLHLLKYISLEQNQGGSHARNIGAKIATGDFLFFLDDDDEFLPSKISTQMNFLMTHDNYDGCVAGFKRMENQKEIISKENFPRVGNFIKFVIDGNFFTPMLCIKKSSFEKVGGFTKIDRFQDRYFMLKALNNHMKFKVFNEVLHIMYEHNDNRISNQNIYKSILSLDTIKTYLLKYKHLFTREKWQLYLKKDNYMRGIIYYNSDTYFKRLFAIKYFFKVFSIEPNLRLLLLIIKSLIPIKMMPKG